MIRTLEPHKAALRAGSSKWQNRKENARPPPCLGVVCTLSAAQTLVGCISRLMLTAERQQDHRGILLTKIAAFIQLINGRNFHNVALSENKTILSDFWETSCNTVLWIQITTQMILSLPLHKHVIYSWLCSDVSVTHVWLEMKSSVKWVLLSNYKPWLFSLIVNHSSIHSYTHFNNEAGKILWSANEETVIKDALLCKHPYVHHLAEQIQGSLMSLHWLLKDTRRPPLVHSVHCTVLAV